MITRYVVKFEVDIENEDDLQGVLGVIRSIGAEDIEVGEHVTKTTKIKKAAEG